MTAVTTTRKEYDDLLKDVIKNRDAVAGERKIKDGTTEYLPPLASMTSSTIESENGNVQIITGHNLTAEGSVSYRKYLSLAYYYGASGRTVDGLTGLIFSKRPTKELNPSIQYLDKNIDGKGTSLRTQAKKVCQDGFITPKMGLFVDFPQSATGVSLAQAEALNLRPKVLFYQFESIINWHYSTVNNEQVLTMLVLREEAEALSNRFTVEKSMQYRVLEIVDNVYVQSIMNDKGESIEDENGEPMDRVPVLVNGGTISEIPFYLIETGSEGKSPINDLVDANIHHYRFAADMAAKEHASAFPVFTETGVSGDDHNVMIGPGAKWTNQNPDAQYGVLQTESDGGSMRTYLQDMEQRMAALGAEMLKPRISSAESAEAKSLDQVAQNSTTSDIADTVSEAYTKALNFCAKWVGAAENAVYQLNTDYNPTSMNPQMFTAQVLAVQTGKISHQTFYENLQKGEVASAERSFEEEKKLIMQNEFGEE